MTPREFKAWFKGFTEAIDGVPSEKQWARIQEQIGKISEIDDQLPRIPYAPCPPNGPGRLYDPEKHPIKYPTIIW